MSEQQSPQEALSGDETNVGKHHVQQVPEGTVDTSTQHTSVTDPADDYKADVPEQPHHDDSDVDAALERDTDDGKGGAVVPKEDFVSYTDENADRPDEETTS